MLKTLSSANAGTIVIGGERQVNRLGYGAMRLTGPGVWGEPANPEEAVSVLRRVVELGVNFIDTADMYGPFVSDMLIKKALHPYQDNLVIATKVGLVRSGPASFAPLGRPEYLRQQIELSLRHLGLECIDLLQLHRIDPTVELSEQLGELVLMQQEGKIRHLGLSGVTVEQLEDARQYIEVASVQNLYNFSMRETETVLEYCEQNGIVFIPYGPIAAGRLVKSDGVLHDVAKRLDATSSQIALAWLLKRSPIILPIPGTSSVAHLEQNIAATGIQLSDEDYGILCKSV